MKERSRTERMMIIIGRFYETSLTKVSIYFFCCAHNASIGYDYNTCFIYFRIKSIQKSSIHCLSLSDYGTAFYSIRKNRCDLSEIFHTRQFCYKQLGRYADISRFVCHHMPSMIVSERVSKDVRFYIVKTYLYFMPDFAIRSVIQNL